MSPFVFSVASLCLSFSPYLSLSACISLSLCLSLSLSLCLHLCVALSVSLACCLLSLARSSSWAASCPPVRGSFSQTPGALLLLLLLLLQQQLLLPLLLLLLILDISLRLGRACQSSAGWRWYGIRRHNNRQRAGREGGPSIEGPPSPLYPPSLPWGPPFGMAASLALLRNGALCLAFSKRQRQGDKCLSV